MAFHDGDDDKDKKKDKDPNTQQELPEEGYNLGDDFTRAGEGHDPIEDQV